MFNRCSNEGLGWKDLDVKYSFTDMVRDIARLDLHTETFKALFTSRLKYASEILFPFIRPPYWGFRSKNVRTSIKKHRQESHSPETVECGVSQSDT